MRKPLPVLLLMIVPSTGLAQYVGLSAFAARNPNFPCDAYLNTVSNARCPAMSVVWGVFGTDDTCVVRFLDALKDRPHLLQIHPWNNVALRNRTTEPGQVFHGPTLTTTGRCPARGGTSSAPPRCSDVRRLVGHELGRPR